MLAKAQWPIRIHATYDESITRMLDVFEKVFKETGYKAALVHRPRGDGLAAEHRADQGMGGGVAVQDRMAFAGEIFAERYGKEAAAHGAAAARK